jgi:antitoxin MazE
MKAELVRIGNARGIRIPKSIIEHCGFGDCVDLRVENGHLVITPLRPPREGWEQAFLAAELSSHEDLTAEVQAAGDFEHEEWRW